MIKTMVLCALLLTPVLAFGQMGATAGGAYRPRSSYDPGAALSNGRQQQSGVSAALQKINPRNTDYGQVIDQVKIAAIEETLDNFYWRSSMVLTVILMFAVLYIMWLLRQREVRINISSDIVAQLYNGHVASRAKALEAIDLHNKLVRRYNARSGEMAKIRLMLEQNEEKADRDKESALVQNIHSDDDENPENPAGKSEGSAASVPNKKALKKDISAEQTEETGDDSAALVRSLQAQLTAKDQKISNLRVQLNRAHSSLTEEREGNGARPS